MGRDGQEAELYLVHLGDSWRGFTRGVTWTGLCLRTLVLTGRADCSQGDGLGGCSVAYRGGGGHSGEEGAWLQIWSGGCREN